VEQLPRESASISMSTGEGHVMPACFICDVQFSLKVMSNEQWWDGGGKKIANTRYWARIVVVNVLLSMNFAAILKTCVSVSAPLQLHCNPFQQ
jgi:hypothetical protein